MNKVHRPLNLAQSSREASFFPVQGTFVSYRYNCIAWTFGQIHFNVGPWQRQARAIVVYGSPWLHRNGSSTYCNTKGP